MFKGSEGDSRYHEGPLEDPSPPAQSTATLAGSGTACALSAALRLGLGQGGYWSGEASDMGEQRTGFFWFATRKAAHPT